MANQITQSTDMIGFISLNVKNEFLTDFNSIAQDTETRVIRDLLGASLFNDLGATPSTQKFVDLFGGVTWQDEEGNDYILTGLNKALGYFVYYEWQVLLPAVNSMVGKNRNNNENSTPLERQDNNIEAQDRYNIGIDFYNEARAFISRFTQYDTTYTSITEAPAGTYTCILSDTTYLEDSDSVTIGGNQYVISSLVSDTSFEFTADTGLTFEVGGNVCWHPFENAKNKKLEKSFFNGSI